MGEMTFSDQQKKKLLALARRTIEEGARGKKKPKAEPDDTQLAIPAGAFVSLHKRGGSGAASAGSRPIHPFTRPLSIWHGPRRRTTPVSTKSEKEELPDIDIEISVLSPLRKISNVKEIEVGRHGIYIIRGGRRGTLLPQVALEQGWNREAFLRHTCMKAGLPPDAYKDEGTEIYIYDAQVFGEKDR